MELLVVGAGEMGRWFAAALQEDGPDPVEVTFCDRDAGAARQAADAVGGEATTNPDETFDLVCVAVPIPAATAAIEQYSSHAETAIVDVTGTMREPLDAMREHAPDCERCSLHPLFTPANEPGNVPIVVDAAGRTVEAVRAALTSRGNDVFETTAATHDEAMETVQARTHAAVLAFALSAKDVPERFQTPISAELVDLAEQVTDGESRVYADIQTAFEGAEDVAAAAQDLAAAEGDAFQRLYEQASPERWQTLPDSEEE